VSTEERFRYMARWWPTRPNRRERLRARWDAWWKRREFADDDPIWDYYG
jgi:hypothetical protein